MTKIKKIAIFICVLEVVLGFCLIVGSKIKETVFLLMSMLLFFLILTLHTATCGGGESASGIQIQCVSDCGCFGDAIKLTPWESFYKDVVLSVLIFIIFAFKDRVKYQGKLENTKILPVALLLVGLFSYFILDWLFPIYFTLILFLLVVVVNKFILKEKREWTLAALTLVTCAAFSYHTYSHLPIRDYRPYAIGKNIINDMTLPEGAKVDVYEDVWKYEVDGTVNEYSTADKPWEIEGAVFVDRQTKLIEEGDHPPIHDFSIESDALGDITDSVLKASNSLVFVMYDLTKSNFDALKTTEKIINGLSDETLTVVALSATTEIQMEQIVKNAGISYPFYFTDETTLKTIVRSNPGMLWLKEGTIVDKFHYNDFPDSENLINQYLR